VVWLASRPVHSGVVKTWDFRALHESKPDMSPHNGTEHIPSRSYRER
jgi:hypothetical protein